MRAENTSRITKGNNAEANYDSPGKKRESSQSGPRRINVRPWNYYERTLNNKNTVIPVAAVMMAGSP